MLVLFRVGDIILNIRITNSNDVLHYCSSWRKVDSKSWRRNVSGLPNVQCTVCHIYWPRLLIVVVQYTVAINNLSRCMRNCMYSMGTDG